MYLLIDILDGAEPRKLNEHSVVDLMEFSKEHSAIIYAEPHHMDDDQSMVVLSEDGEFGVIPRCDPPHLPDLVDKWTDKRLAAFFFETYRKMLKDLRK